MGGLLFSLQMLAVRLVQLVSATRSYRSSLPLTLYIFSIRWQTAPRDAKACVSIVVAFCLFLLHLCFCMRRAELRRRYLAEALELTRTFLDRLFPRIPIHPFMVGGLYNVM
jgi:hypothetical protein